MNETQTVRYVCGTYTNWTNIDSHFGRAYQPGDRLVRGWQGRMSFQPGDDVELIAERLFYRHNMDDRPDGRMCPSMSVGDVIVIGEVAVSVASLGFQVVQLDAADLITDKTWSEAIGL